MTQTFIPHDHEDLRQPSRRPRRCYLEELQWELCNLDLAARTPLGPTHPGNSPSSAPDLHQHDNGKLTKCQKVYIPDHPTYNFVGRILGPRGISVRRLEADTDCTILIRGRGSIKDQDREDKLRDSPGYEHLKERLHVLVIAEDFDLAVCSEKLHRAVSAIERLLTPDFDGYKRKQLIQASYLSSYLRQAIIQLAIINGTYRQ